MKNLTLAAILVALFLGGCTTLPGPFNGNGKDPMNVLSVYRGDGQKHTDEQYALIVKVAQEASIVVGSQLSSSAEAAAASGIAFGTAGLGGFFDGNISAAVGVFAASLAGTVTGLQTASYAIVWQIAEITEARLRWLEVNGDEKIRALVKDLHVSAGYIRTRNTSEGPAPGSTQP